MTELAVEIYNVSKLFPRKRGMRDLMKPWTGRFREQEKPTRALEGVNLTVARGEVFGLLGPNGSGKTSLQKIICGLLRPESGTVKVLGKEITECPSGSEHLVSYVFDGERSFYWRLTGQQNLEFFGAMSGCSIDTVRQNIPRLAGLLDLEQHLNKPVADFSAGSRQKLSLIRSLLTSPAVLVMDEATRSLDPEVALQVCSLVKGLAGSENKTVIWATHNLAEAESTCDRIAILNKGRILAEAPAAGCGEIYFDLLNSFGRVGAL